MSLSGADEEGAAETADGALRVHLRADIADGRRGATPPLFSLRDRAALMSRLAAEPPCDQAGAWCRPWGACRLYDQAC